MSTLVELQRALQAHIVDGAAEIAAAIDSSDSMPASTRLKIYYDAYRLRLIEALQANYPALEKLLGTDEFARLAQLYLAAHPSRHFSIRWFGHELAAFLHDFDEYRSRPWLAELASWEWAIACAFDAADAEALRIEDLSNVPPEEWSSLRFDLHPSVQRLRLTTNAAALAKAAGNDAPLPQPARLEQPIEWLIWRKDLTVNFRSLDAPEAAALDAVRASATFEDMCEQLAHFIDDGEVPLRAAGYLRQWIQDGILIAKVKSAKAESTGSDEPR